MRRTKLLSSASVSFAVGLFIGVLASHADIASQFIARLVSPPPAKKARTIESLSTSALAKFERSLREKDSVIIVAFGDSVTRGATSKGALDTASVYHHQLKNVLEERYADVIFNVINAGVGGDKASDGLARLNEDVIRFAPDLVIIGFGLNDSVTNGLAGLRKFKLTMSEILRRIQQQTSADIVALTPNFLATSDNQNIDDEHRSKGWGESFAKTQNSGVLERYAQTIREIGSEHGVPIGDVYSMWQQISDSVNTNKLLANGLNHPDARGHRIIAEILMNLIDPEYTCDRQRILTIVTQE